MLLTGCSSQLYRHQTVQNVGLEKFSGTWYVWANIPTIFEKNAYNAVEKYTIQNDQIKIDFTYHKGSVTGELKSYPQDARVFDKSTNAHWKVKIPWLPIKMDYLIVGLESDYSATVVSVPDKNYLWIMGRQPLIDPPIYDKIINQLKTQQYDITKILKVPQEW